MKLQTRLAIILSAFTIGISGILILIVYHNMKANGLQNLRDKLFYSASIMSQSINGNIHEKIRKPADEKSKNYLLIKKQLGSYLNQYKYFRYAYTMKKDSMGKIRFVVDAETNLKLIAHVGDEYFDASPYLKKNFDSIDSVHVEKKVYTDRWGTWLTGYAPIFNKSKNIVAILGLDISLEKIEKQQKHFLVQASLYFLLAMSLSVIVGYFLGKKIAGPVVELKNVAIHIAGGELDTEIPIKGYLETCELADSLSNMTSMLRGLISTLEDEISRKEQTEKILRESEERFRALSENSYDTIMRFDRQGRHLYVNAIVEKQTGIKPDDFIGKTHKELGFPPELIEIWEPAISRVFATGKSERLEFKLPPNLWIDWLLVPELDENKQVIAVLTSARDITERKKAEEELKRTKNYLDTLINSLQTMIISTGRDGDIIQWNRETEKYSKIGISGIVGKKVWEIFPFLGPYKDMLLSSISSKKTYREFLHDENNTCYDFSFYPMEFENYTETVIHIDDVTDMVKKDAQLIQAQKMESIGNLSGGLAHDFNNALVGIVGTISLIKNSLKKGNLTDDKLNDYIETIENASTRAADMIARLMAVTRKKDIEHKPVDLNKALKDVIEVCSNSFDKSIILHSNYVENEKPVIFADESEIGQVILNLMINAMHAMTIMREEGEKGGIITSSIEKVQLDRQAANFLHGARHGFFWKISIQDTGIGIPQDLLSRIYDPFFSTKKENKGSGLGLAMVYNIVRRSNGFIDVNSSPGQGTTFNLFFPAVNENEKEWASTYNDENIQTGEGLLLMVDDEEVVRQTGTMLLKECGYDIITASGGKEAIAIYTARGQEIDAVILDMSMPEMNGREAFLNLKKINPDIKVILTSGLWDDEKIQETLDLGVTCFIKKPFSIIDFSRKLKQVLET